MARRVPRWLVALNVVAVAIILVGVLGVKSLLNAIDAGKLKRSLADVRSLVTAMEEYREDHGHYPVGFAAQQLRSALEPEYMRKYTYDELVDVFWNEICDALEEERW